MTASHPINEWLSDLKNRGKSEHTQAAYRRALEHFVTWNKNTYATVLQIRKPLIYEMGSRHF